MTAAALLVSSCAAPEAYPPPFQRPALQPDPVQTERFVEMGDPDAGDYIVRDISPQAEGTGWRWTNQRPELRFRLDATRNQTLAVDLSFPQVTFAQTGPVNLSYFVNGRLLATLRYPAWGDYHFEKRVPEDWLRTDSDTSVVMEPDKVWVSPDDGVRLGFVLVRAGFLP